MPRRIASSLAALALFGLPIGAHHHITAIYDAGRNRAMEGVVVEFQFVNPHPFLIVDVPGNAGGADRWRLEMDNRFELAGIGFDRDTLRPGDRVEVAGSPARNGEKSLYLRRLDRRADGFWYVQVGASPRMGWSTPDGRSSSRN